jgi:hypothetical protein
MSDPLAPAAGPSANLGYGKQTEATIDHANIAMRSMPWYQEQMRQWGQDPGHPTLAKSQSQQILKLAQAHGFQVDEGNMEVDPGGNFNPKGHKLRNTIIVAGLAAGAYFALPAIIAAASSGGAAGAGAAAGTAGLGGVEAGVTAGLGAAALPGAGTALGVAGGLGGAAAAGGGAAALGGGGALASTALPTVAGTVAGGTGLAGGTTAATGGIGSTILGAAKNYASKGNGAQGYLQTAGEIGNALGANAAGRAAGRVDESAINQRQDQIAQQRYQNEINAAKLNLDAPGQRASTSVHGDILANAKPFTWGGGTDMVGNIPVPRYSGGLSPEMFSDNTRALGSQMSSQALADNGAMGGRAIGAAPGLTELPQSGATDSILNTAGTLGNFASILSNYAGAKKKQPVPVYGDGEIN